jgi:tRNA G10  N-methylase Trm11
MCAKSVFQDVSQGVSQGVSQSVSQSICILGRQPAIGLAELESLFGSEAVKPAGPIAALLAVDHHDVNFQRLGGSIKLAKLLTRLETTQWPAIEKYLRQSIPQHLQYVPEGKMKLGLSVHGFDISIPKLNATGLTLKKIIKSSKTGGRSIRVVPNKELELNSAQVLHNQLTSPTGWEILIIRDGDTTILAQTTDVQDIDAYAARDQGRPKRDARVGMLPPKLAQTIVNLAGAESDPKLGTLLLDPFCGTGVVLQEASLMGFDIYGTDLEPRMVEYTGKNIDWLADQYDQRITAPKLEAGDATSHRWNPSPALVATEIYLGQPFSSFPDSEKLAEIRNTCNTILRKFLQNIHGQIQPGTRLCLAVPAWQQANGSFTHLPTLDHLEELGYNRISFKHAENKDLVYARADQIVARELLVLHKI